jgi:hypothetical protein
MVAKDGTSLINPESRIFGRQFGDRRSGVGGIRVISHSLRAAWSCGD